MFTHLFIRPSKQAAAQEAQAQAQEALRNRGTGRTDRKCLEAMLMASSGYKVVFVSGNSVEHRLLADKLHSISPVRSLNRDLITFPNGGELHLRTMHSNFRGWRVDYLITDELLGANWREIERFLMETKHIIKGEN